MLDDLDLTLKLERAEYRKVLPHLRTELGDLQRAARTAGLPVVVVFEGWDAAGKGDSIGHLVYPLDPRGFKVYTTQAPDQEQRLRPFLMRFWTRLPARGDFVFFDRSWYRRLLENRLEGEVRGAAVPGVAAEICEFERQLTDARFVLVKLWLHVSRQEQKRRLKRIKADSYEQWRTAQREWRRRPGYKKYAGAAEKMIELTSTAHAPWTLVEATDPLFRRVKVFRAVIAAVRDALEAQGKSSRSSVSMAGSKTDASARSAVPRDSSRKGPEERELERIRRVALRVRAQGTKNLLDRVDLTQRLSRAEYEKRLDPLQQRLRDLALECYRVRLPVVIVYEGWDAAGKGGNIKRLTQELDPRGYEVIPIAAPDATERQHHYLWRFWRNLPKAGHIGIFDRSWYGRVLVERVEGFATEAEWRRAYQEITDFERQLAQFGTVIVKFWLHLSPEEQLRRFRARERIAYKRYKIGLEDWRNRAKWNAYREAVAEMLERTSAAQAPWTVVEAEDKLWARIRTLTVLVKALERRLKA